MIATVFQSSLFRFAFAWATLASVATATQGQDYQPSFHPDRLKLPPGGTPNDVMVLGTPHLSGLPDTFTSEMLSPLLKRLAVWAPEAIATEDLSGLQCYNLRHYPSRYELTVEYYCFDPSLAAKATGLDVPAANAEAERLLAAWPDTPTSADRRHLAAIFLAAGERASALVQWLRLSPEEQVEGDSLNAELVVLLNKIKDTRNETYLVAAPLAAQLGLERIWSVDDHSSDMPDPAEPEDYAKKYAAAIDSAWDNSATKARAAESETLQAGLAQPGGLLKMYLAYNDPEAAMQVYRSDFGAALAEPSPQGFGRGYVGSWETRNLRMVSNIRDVLGQYPGTRMLAIVGASHKGYYEAYLNQMHDVHLVDANCVLR